jgi:hypothetical protein
MKYYNQERAHGHNIPPCEPHRCSSYGHTFYWPIHPSGQHSFMEEVSSVTLLMFFIVMCIYIYFLLYVFILIFYFCCSAVFTPW